MTEFTHLPNKVPDRLRRLRQHYEWTPDDSPGISYIAYPDEENDEALVSEVCELWESLGSNHQAILLYPEDIVIADDLAAPNLWLDGIQARFDPSHVSTNIALQGIAHAAKTVLQRPDAFPPVESKQARLLVLHIPNPGVLEDPIGYYNMCRDRVLAGGLQSAQRYTTEGKPNALPICIVMPKTLLHLIASDSNNSLWYCLNNYAGVSVRLDIPG
jgi:hypothetical protein